MPLHPRRDHAPWLRSCILFKSDAPFVHAVGMPRSVLRRWPGHLQQAPQPKQCRAVLVPVLSCRAVHTSVSCVHCLLHNLASYDMQGVTNFAVFSSAATAVSLVLFSEADLVAGRPTHEVALHPRRNRSGHTWHIALPGLNSSLLYGGFLQKSRAL